MDILFISKKLEGICREEKRMVKQLGRNGARKLRARLKDLSAAANMEEVRVGRPHLLRGDFAGCLALDLDGGRRLVLEAADDPIPRREDESIDWGSVTRIRIVFIGDYHD